jgi:hypothetical protein
VVSKNMHLERANNEQLKIMHQSIQKTKFMLGKLHARMSVHDAHMNHVLYPLKICVQLHLGRLNRGKLRLSPTTRGKSKIESRWSTVAIGNSFQQMTQWKGSGVGCGASGSTHHHQAWG